MSDLIDRQAAIDVIDKEQKEIDVSDVSAMYAYSKCKMIIKQLPSVLGTNLAEVGTDLISRQQAIGALRNYLVGKNVPCDGTLTCRLIENEVISKLPSAQPEQRTGKWIPQDHNKRAGNISTCVYCYPICSKCGKVGIETYKYCPMCGAKMEGADDE